MAQGEASLQRTGSAGVAQASAAGVQALGAAVWTDERVQRVAVIGASKNAGKTTALNALQDAASAHGHCVGLVSIGRDGEAHDAWLDVAKPGVWAEKGTLVVTTQALAEATGGALKVIANAGFSSSLGPTIVARAQRALAVELCGVPHRGNLDQAIAALKELGASRILVDGAYHRQAPAHPRVADAVVAAVGSIVATDLQGVLPAAAPTLRALTLPQRTSGECADLKCEGALSDAWLLPRLRQGINIVAQTPSHVLLSAHGWQQIARLQVKVHVAHAVPLRAVTINPHRPGGQDDGVEALARSVVEFLSETITQGFTGARVPVIDVVSGRAWWPNGTDWRETR